MLRRILITSSILSITACFSLASGCSSSSGGNGSSGSSSGATEESGADTSSGSSSGSTGSSSGGEDATGSSSGATGSSSGGSGSSSGSTSTCPPSGDAGAFTAPTYAPATKGQGVCQMTDIQAFITACVTTPAGCQAWIAANIAGGAADGGGAGTTCGNCIFKPDNSGGVWLDPNNYFGPNYAGCIQLTDPTNGAACAAAFNNINGCDGNYCDIYQGSQTNYTCCTTAENGTGGTCASYNSTEMTACNADLTVDGGALAASCFPGSGSTAQQTDLTYVINLICGGGD
jgi:hypothetical protein